MCRCRAVALELQGFGGNSQYWSTVMDTAFCKERKRGWQQGCFLSPGSAREKAADGSAECPYEEKLKETYRITE